MGEIQADRSRQKIVVFGGAGYLGSVLTGQLLERGYQVEVFDSLLFGRESLTAYEGNPNYQLIVGDLANFKEVKACVRCAGAVILLAGLVNQIQCDRDPKFTVDINLIATKAVAEACKDCEVPRFIFASSDSVYGIQEGMMQEKSPLNPISLYGRLKAQAEAEFLGIQDANFCPTILRMATIYGLSPRMRFDLIINILALDAATRGKITIFGGKQWRPLVHVADAARAYVTALEAPVDVVSGRIFNVGSNEQNYQIATLGELVRQVFPNVLIETVPQKPDLRDYHVCCDEIQQKLGYQVKYSVLGGIKEIRAALQDGTITDYNHPWHYNAPNAAS